MVAQENANGGPKEDALQVVERWTKAFTASDVDGIAKLYSPDALFIGTRSKTVLTTPAQIRQYFEAALLSDRPRTATLNSFSANAISDSVVVINGLDTVTGVKDGKTISGRGRVTFVVARQGSNWEIVQFHRSPMPD